MTAPILYRVCTRAGSLIMVAPLRVIEESFALRKECVERIKRETEGDLVCELFLNRGPRFGGQEFVITKAANDSVFS